jgi:5-oxoprolinase (ATP-hydrolysing)
MTNTRITDPEVLESRFPVRVIEFSIRRGSGGDGKWSGGDGICRTFEFLRKVQVSMLSERRTRPPFGLAGGCPGSPGINRIDGQEVGGNFSCEVVPGQHLRIETPGGGGYGAR